MRGGFNNSLMQYEDNFPILLRSDSYINKIIVRQTNENVLHHGVKTTLENNRSVTCIKFQGTTLKPPKSTDLCDFHLFNSCAF